MWIALGLYFATRLLWIDSPPIFLDEAVHIQWAERLLDEGRFVKPIGAGRLLAVLAYIPATLLEDRWLAARVIAVAAGAVALIFCVLTAWELFGRAGAMTAAAVQIAHPLAFLYDRLALSDVFLSATISACLYFTVCVALGRDTPMRARTLTIFCALAWMSKVSAVLFLVALPLAAWLSPDSTRWSAAMKRVSFSLVAGTVLAFPMLLVFFRNSGEILAQHTAAGSADVESANAFATSALASWALSYWTPALLLALLGSIALLHNRRVFFLAVAHLVPAGLLITISNPWSARYILPLVPFSAVLIGGGIAAVATRTSNWVAVGSAAAALAIPLTHDFRMIRDFATAPLPEDERLQLVTGWPAGYGVRAIADRLVAEAGSAPARVFVESAGPRNPATSLAILLPHSVRIQMDIQARDLNSSAVRFEIESSAREVQTFVVASLRHDGNGYLSTPSLVADRLIQASRPGGEWAGSLFSVRAVSRD